MHYQINDYLVESELAAKPVNQTNKYVLNFINCLPHESNVLDYGCGKLRYALQIAKRVANVVAIDSSFQIYKKQIINGIHTTVQDYAKKYHNNITVYEIDTTIWKSQKYDVVFCTNVLSAIPDDQNRLELLINAKNVITTNGYVFITIQYRNSYFKNYEFRTDTLKYNDGWLIHRNNKKYSFYGLITKQKIITLCNIASLKIFELIRHDGSLYIKAK